MTALRQPYTNLNLSFYAVCNRSECVHNWAYYIKSFVTLKYKWSPGEKLRNVQVGGFIGVWSSLLDWISWYFISLQWISKLNNYLDRKPFRRSLCLWFIPYSGQLLTATPWKSMDLWIQIRYNLHNVTKSAKTVAPSSKNYLWDIQSISLLFVILVSTLSDRAPYETIILRIETIVSDELQ